MGARFRNFYKVELTMWWDDGTEKGVYSGFISPNGNTATNTYTTHTFIFRNKNTDEVVERYPIDFFWIKLALTCMFCSVKMVEDRHLYFLGPAKSDTEVMTILKLKGFHLVTEANALLHRR